MEVEELAKPRLVITEMVLENFKSYAGAQRIGPFHKNFSSVVGPNGSGKSNVIDAMLFVFGKRAKQLRLNKVSELIHNSAAHRNLTKAKVSVFFEEIVDLDDDNFESVPGSQFAVSRTASRDNTSEYFINERKSNFTEVTSMLKGKGIDLDNNRFLILQGEVEQISLMKPKGQTEHDTGLLEYLEDIIGTDRYLPMIEEGAKKLEELNEQRQGLVQRVKIAEKERRNLDAEKAAAEAYLTKELDCLKAKKQLAHLFADDAERNVNKIKENVVVLDQKLQHERSKAKDHKASLEAAETRYNAVVDQHASLAKELEGVTSQFKEFERKDIKYREDLKHLKTKLKKLEDKTKHDESRLAACQEEARAAETALPQLKTTAEKLTKQLGDAEKVLEDALEGIKDEVEGLQSQLRQARSELAPWQAQTTEIRSRMDIAVSERDLLNKQAAEAATKLSEAQAELKQVQVKAQSKSKEAKEMEANLTTLMSKVEEAVKQEEAAQVDVERLAAASREVRGTAHQRKAEASHRVAASMVVSALLEAKAKGGSQYAGIWGRLGDLGAIDRVYDVAVSTACPALDYIVVDTTSTAQRCVELLRKRRLGVGTFLILEKQAALEAACRETPKPSPPEGCARLFDLVHMADKKLAPAFYFAMRDTVVAENLDQASRIAYQQGNKRWRRVVTLAGDMINDTGTMSGGGAKPRGGRMALGSKPPSLAARSGGEEDKKELATAERELEQTTQALAQARSRHAEALAQVKAARMAVEDVEAALPKVKLEAEAARDRTQDLQAALPALQAAAKMSKEDKDRCRVLEQDIATEQKALVHVEAKSARLVARVTELETAIAQAGGAPLAAARRRVEELQQRLEETEANTTKAEVTMKTAAKQVEKLGREVSKYAAERETLLEKQEATSAEFKALEDAAFKIMELVQSRQNELSAKEEELAAIRAAFETQQRQVSIILQVEVDIAAEIEGQKAALKEEEGKVVHWNGRAEEHRQRLESLGNEDHCDDDSDETNVQELQYRITVLEEELARMSINMEAIEAWKAADTEYGRRVAALEELSTQRDQVKRAHDELRKTRLDEFMAGFNTISLKLKEMYQMITMGGDAELELVDSLDPFSEGILFSVRPPKKSWKNISNLSGGEKTLSSLSLVFALHHYKPTPLYVMDEIDAALDFKNVSIVGHYIKERTKNAQFVIISLRNNMFELADRLVGIYKTDNATKSVAINPGLFTVGGLIPAAVSG